MTNMKLASHFAEKWGQQKKKWSRAISSSKIMKMKVVDLYRFTAIVSYEEYTIIREVKRRVKDHRKLWLLWEQNKGPGWHLERGLSSVSEINLVNFADCVELKKLIRKGIHPELRSKVWMGISGAANKSSTVPSSYYTDLISAVQGKITDATLQIDHDLARTFPSHPWLDTPEGHAAMRRILVAYSFRDSQVGYCQGMNYVAGLLVLVMKTEEEAFWMLAVLLENILIKDCYNDDLAGCHVEQRVFKDLLKKNCPRLVAHLDIVGFDVSLVITEWFLCLFAKSLPSETVMRVWDVLFNEGARVLLRVALSIFKIKEVDILSKHNVGEIINMLRETTRAFYDADELLKVGFEMTLDSIGDHRSKHQEDVMGELENRVQRLNSLKLGSKVLCQ